MRNRFLALTVIVLLAGGAMPVAAQLNNEPYRGSLRAGGFGMSLGHRQAILEKEFFGRTSNPLVRGLNGALLEVERRDDQAFLRRQDQAFAPLRRFAPAATGLGWGVGATTANTVTTLSTGTAGRSLFWLSMLDEPAYRLPWSGLTAGSTFGTPIDTWIGQIDGAGAP